MILGYISIGLTVLIILVLAISRIEKPLPYYIGAYVVGSFLLLSATLASQGLVGSDIHLEHYYAYQSQLNGWNTTLPCTINTCLPVVLVAPAISSAFNIDLIWVFKIIFPLLYAFVPVLLVYIYSRFIPVKWAFLSAMIFIIMPTFFLEMPAISRQMIAELIVVGMIALLVSESEHKYKMLGLLVGSIAVTLCHYSTATFWFVFLFVTVIGYLATNQKWRTLDIGVVLLVSVIVFWVYSKSISSGWIMVDFGNVVSALVPDSISETLPITVTSTTDINKDFQITSTSSLFFIIPSILILTYGSFRLLKSKKIDKLYKVWIITAFILLIAVLVYPAISQTINYTRYYHMMLIFLAPAIIYTFKKYNVQIMASGLIIAFLFTSGLVFNLLKIDNIAKVQLPYSIALENQKLDAGNYLTQDDIKVSKWASEHGIKEVYADLGGVAAMQDYLSLYQVKPLNEAKTNSYIFMRSWNNEQKKIAVWVGPGLRKQITKPEINKLILYQSGNSILYGR